MDDPYDNTFSIKKEAVKSCRLKSRFQVQVPITLYSFCFFAANWVTMVWVNFASYKIVVTARSATDYSPLWCDGCRRSLSWADTHFRKAHHEALCNLDTTWEIVDLLSTFSFQHPEITKLILPLHILSTCRPRLKFQLHKETTTQTIPSLSTKQIWRCWRLYLIVAFKCNF